MPTPLSLRRVLVGASFSRCSHSLFLALVLLTLLRLAPGSFAQAGTASANPPLPSPMLTAVSVSPTNVIGGASSTGTVTVSSTGSGLANISLSSNSSAVQVPSGVSLSATTGKITFPVTTTAVSSATPVTITASQQYATGNGFLNIVQTATLTVTPAPAPAVPAYLSNLTLSSTTITSGSGATGTVTLSSSAPANIVVALHSNNSGVTVPATCTVLANMSQANFNIKTTAVSSSPDVTISGSYNGWTQGDELSVVPPGSPAGPSPGVPLIQVAPGNGCVVVNWNRLADGTVSGYNVYRITGGTKTLLTATPFASNFYPDTGLTNDTATYTYQVSAVDMQGKEQPLSDPVSATPSSATATLNWINPPSAVTDRLLMKVSLSSGSQVFGGLYSIDGQQFGGGGSQAPNVNGVQTYTAGAGFDSTKLSNGPHTVQFLSFADANQTIAAVTPPITIQVSNTISNDSTIGNWFDPTQGEVCYLSATVPAGSTWTVQVTPQDSATVLRTWQGASSLVKLAWDGKDAAGNPMPLTDYSLLLTVQPPGTSPSTTGAQAAPNAAGAAKKNHSVSLLHSQPPFALALVSIGASFYVDSNGNPVETPAQDSALSTVVTNAYTTLFGAGNFKVIRSDTFDPDHVNATGNPKKLTELKQLKGWLGTAQVFYLVGHGASTQGAPGPSQTPRSTVFGAFDQQQGEHLELFSTPVAFTLRADWLVVPTYVKGNNYVFAWIDACNSAGGNAVTGEIGTPNYAWATAFNATTFVGNNGFAISNSHGPTDTSDWYKWRSTFWNNLAMGQPVTHAYLQCWVVDGKRKGPGGTDIPYGDVAPYIYPDYYYIGTTFYPCTPADGYGGNPRVVLYGEPYSTTLVPQ